MVLAFHGALQEEGIRINQVGKWFLSTAHDAAVIDELGWEWGGDWRHAFDDHHLVWLR